MSSDALSPKHPLVLQWSAFNFPSVSLKGFYSTGRRIKGSNVKLVIWIRCWGKGSWVNSLTGDPHPWQNTGPETATCTGGTGFQAGINGVNKCTNVSMTPQLVPRVMCVHRGTPRERPWHGVDSTDLSNHQLIGMSQNLAMKSMKSSLIFNTWLPGAQPGRQKRYHTAVLPALGLRRNYLHWKA